VFLITISPFIQNWINTQMELASRVKRLIAFILDIVVVFIFVIFCANFIPQGHEYLENYIIFPVHERSLNQEIIVFLIGQCIFLFLNGMLLYESGQTIGKKLLKIKITSTKGMRMGFFKLYFIRVLLFDSVLLIPLIGEYIWLLNILFIFGKKRRCLHDLVTGSIVVNEIQDN